MSFISLHSFRNLGTVHTIWIGEKNVPKFLYKKVSREEADKIVDFADYEGLDWELGNPDEAIFGDAEFIEIGLTPDNWDLFEIIGDWK